MNLEDPKIKAAFIRGYLNKQAESGLEKSAFLVPLLSALGGLGGGLATSALAGRYLAPRIGAWAERSLLARKGLVGAGKKNKGIINKGLNYLASPQAKAIKVNGKLRQYTGTGASDISNTLGFSLGMPVGTAATSALLGGGEEPLQQDQLPYQA